MIRSGSKLRGTACVILRGPGRQDPMEKTRPGSILLGAGLGESAGLLFKRWQSRKLCAIEAPGKGHVRQGLEPRRHGHAQLFPHTERRGAAGRPGMPAQVAGGVPTSCGRRRRGVGPRRQPGLAQHQRPLPLPLYARAYGGRQLRGLRRRALVLRRRHRQPSPRVRARAPRAATWSYNPDSPPQST